MSEMAHDLPTDPGHEKTTGPPKGTGRSDEHVENLDDLGWCQKCGCAYPCPGSVVPAPVGPVSLTRGGFMLGR